MTPVSNTVWDELCHLHGWTGPREANASNSGGLHLLDWALAHAIQHVPALLAGGTSPKLARRNPLHMPSVIDAGLAAGADVNRREEGITALMVHISARNIDAMRRLLAAGADPNACDEQGWSCLRMALVMGEPRMIDVLLASGAQGPQGETETEEWRTSSRRDLWALWQNHQLLQEIPAPAGAGPRPRLCSALALAPAGMIRFTSRVRARPEMAPPPACSSPRLKTGKAPRWLWTGLENPQHLEYTMKKIPTVFAIDRDSGMATPVPHPASTWVLEGEGRASVKMDGMATLFRDGRLWKRYDRKLNKQAAARKARGLDIGPVTQALFKTPPDGFEPCEAQPDPVSFHWPGWVPVHATDPADRWLREAWEHAGDLEEGMTYELVGPSLALNVYGLARHELRRHGEVGVEVSDRSFDGLRAFLAATDIEGLVFEHPDGRRAKVRRKDFDLFWVQEDPRKHHRRPRAP